jgi:hypothetical protein
MPDDGGRWPGRSGLEEGKYPNDGHAPDEPHEKPPPKPRPAGILNLWFHERGGPGDVLCDSTREIDNDHEPHD